MDTRVMLPDGRVVDLRDGQSASSQPTRRTTDRPRWTNPESERDDHDAITGTFDRNGRRLDRGDDDRDRRGFQGTAPPPQTRGLMRTLYRERPDMFPTVRSADEMEQAIVRASAERRCGAFDPNGRQLGYVGNGATAARPRTDAEARESAARMDEFARDQGWI